MGWKDAPEVSGWQSAPLVEQSKPDTYTTTGGFLENAAAGLGKAVADIGRGGSMLIRRMGPQYNASADFLGLPNAQDIIESRERDKALMSTGGGIVGNIAGNALPVALTGGLGASLPAATAVGAATGAIQPAVTNKEAALNIGLGALGGLGGQAIANWSGKAVAAREVTRSQMADAISDATRGAAKRRIAPPSAAATQAAQKFKAAKDAMAAGYVIPPADLSNSKLVQAVSGLSGKIKTAQEASARNQQVTNKLAREALGVADDAPLNVETLNGIRSAAGQAYEAVSSAGTIQPSKAYTDALDRIAAPFVKAAEGFPNAKPNPIIAELDSLRSPQFDAASAVAKIRELRGSADTAYAQGNKELGKALRGASEALEATIEEHLKKVGQPAADMLKGFRDARQLIAKTYTVQKALNGETGDVSAQVLKRELERNKPLSGGLLTIAKTGKAFERATQALKESPKTLSPFDFGAAGLGLMSTGGNPLAAVGLVARPAARNMLLSGPAQSMALRAVGNPQQANMLARILQNEEVALPIGVLSGGAMANYLAQQ